MLRKLGEGGMGSVFLVEDSLENNKGIALKTIKTDQQKLPALQRFKNEFKSLTELRHPNLAEVYDFGIIRNPSSKEEEYFFTMEYVEGKDFFEASENLTYDELYEIIVQICKALDYVHLRGFLHNDLKPENILVKNPEKGKYQTKLMDFGLAEENPTPGKIKGTAFYIAPEIALSKSATPLSDLYSLGVVLYQVCTRQLPFQGKDAVEILRNQIDQDPIPPQRIKADIPSPLQSIILKLLSKNSKNRFQSANEVIEALNRLAQKDFKIDTQDAGESFLLSGKFIGRESECFLFEQSLQNLLKDKKGGVILIRGVSGIGKSRLLSEFKYQAQLNSLNFFAGNIASEGGAPYQPIKEILKQILPQYDKSLQKKYSGILERLIPESFHSESPVELAKLNPEQEKIKLFDGITQLILEFSESTPSVFGFDDLQLADSSSLELLCYISRNIKGYPILLLGTYQDREKSGQKEETSFEREVGELQTEGFLSELCLKAFELKEIEKLLQSILGMESLPAGFIQKVKELTAGNPLFLQEVIKAIFEKKSFSRKDLFWFLEKFNFSELKIPRTLKGIISERIRNLKPELLNVAQTIAAFNRAVETGVLKKAISQHKDSLSSTLKALEKLEIIKVEQDEGAEVYSFTNAQIREVIHAEMESESKKKLHGELGYLLVDFYGSDHKAHSEELAYHFNNSFDQQKGLSYSLLAGRRSKKIFANSEAVRFFESTIQFLENKRNHKVLSRVFENLIDLYQLLGSYDLAVQKFDEWIKICAQARRKAMAFEKIGMIYEKKGEYDLALENLKNGIKHLAPEEKSSEMARLFYDSGYVYARKGEFDQAKEQYEKALNILKDKKDNYSRKEIGKLHNATGMVHWFQSEYDKAIGCYNRSIEIF
ncbi:MAG: protein kinase, partial [candidate division Zixibacteria bacterium]|nr:protein kinase [candidate division Zixibacteria bacterium]